MLTETAENKRTFTDPEINAIEKWVQKAVGETAKLELDQKEGNRSIRFIILNSRGKHSNNWVRVYPTDRIDWFVINECDAEGLRIKRNLLKEFTKLCAALKDC